MPTFYRISIDLIWWRTNELKWDEKRRKNNKNKKNEKNLYVNSLTWCCMFHCSWSKYEAPFHGTQAHNKYYLAAFWIKLANHRPAKFAKQLNLKIIPWMPINERNLLFYLLCFFSFFLFHFFSAIIRKLNVLQFAWE